MHTETGEIRDYSAIYDLPEQERKKFVPITRDLTAREKATMQIRLYAPCGCGSGKKFKFCCRRKPSRTLHAHGPDESNTNSPTIQLP